MQQPEMRQATEKERNRAIAVVETLAGMRFRGGTVAEVEHDARNMVTALALYCDLLEEPGVLPQEYRHYAMELRLVAAASRRVVEKLAMLDGREEREPEPPATIDRAPRDFFADMLAVSPLVGRAPRLPNDPIDNLQEEVLANHNLLDSIAGMAIAVTVRTEGGARPVRLSSEDLTRVLVNLIKNSAEAIGAAGRIEITLRERLDPDGEAPEVVLAVVDSGPGIPADAVERVFEPGYTTRSPVPEEGAWAAPHRGLGLAITRSIVEAAGGRVRAIPRPQGGADIEIALPIRSR